MLWLCGAQLLGQTRRPSVLRSSLNTSSPNRRNTSGSIRPVCELKIERDARKNCKANTYNDEDDMDTRR